MLGFRQSLLATLSVIGLSVAPLSCSSTGGTDGLFAPTGTKGAVTGDWVDIDAAVLAATEKNQMAVVDHEQVNDTTLRFNILTAKSESGTIYASRDTAVDPKVRLSREGPIVIKLTVKVGMFGDTRREQQLIQDIGTRLSMLEGPFKTAPVPSNWTGWGS